MIKIFIMLLILSIYVLMSFETKEKMPLSKPDNFNFVIKYGYQGKNKINTYNNTFTKDLVRDGTVMINLILTNDEMDYIYNEMAKIAIVNYSKKFYVPSNKEVQPHQNYYFKIQLNDKTKEIYWKDTDPYTKDKAADNLRNLVEKVKNIIEQKEKYKSLPKASGGYI